MLVLSKYYHGFHFLKKPAVNLQKLCYILHYLIHRKDNVCSICNFFTFVVIIHFWGSLPLTLLKNIPSMELSN
jgi:hypothetical protein